MATTTIARALLAVARGAVGLACRVLAPCDGDVYDAEISALLTRADLAREVLR